jgi:RNA polymerase sigma-70 factor (ECF subfamily)
MVDRQARDSSTSDRDLITRAAAGDRPAFEQLVERHAAAVLRLARVITGEAATAEDALQQTFLSAYQNASTFRADASVRTWLLAIATNAARRIRAKTSREDLVEEPWMELGLDAGWGSEDPEAIVLAAERKDTLRRALSALSPEDQEVLVLRDIEGLHGSEAAALLGLGERALKSRLHRARLRLAAALRREPQINAGQEGHEP